MKYIYILIAILFFATNLNAQIDTQESSVTIAVEENENSNTTTNLPKIEKPNTNVGLSTTNENTINGISVTKADKDLNKNEEFSMVYKSNLINPGTIFKEKWRKDKPVKTNEKVNIGDDRKDLGEVKTSGKFIIAALGDFGVVDGDDIRIYANDDIIKPRLYLTHSYKTIKIKLIEGANTIDFQAISQGEVGPNTAEIIIYDDKGKILISNSWNLKTGGIANATIIKVVKEKND